MREIKFQYVWKNKTSMAFGVYNLDEIENGNPTAPITNGKRWELVDRRQFTGLKDLNGVDIYENDKIKAVPLNKNDFNEWEGFVTFDDFKLGWYCDGEQLGAYESFELEVIGNIYQNKTDNHLAATNQ